jgi:small subunit ribosomal protein S16
LVDGNIMVKIRLSRAGANKRPFYHLVVTDSRNKRDGRYIERLGFYNPFGKEKEEDIRVDLDRVQFWVERGAQISDRVKKLLKLIKISKEDREKIKNLKQEKRKLKKHEAKLANQAPAEEVKEEAPAEEVKEEAKEEAPAEEAPAEEVKEEAKEEAPAEEEKK